MIMANNGPMLPPFEGLAELIMSAPCVFYIYDSTLGRVETLHVGDECRIESHVRDLLSPDMFSKGGFTADYEVGAAPVTRLVRIWHTAIMDAQGHATPRFVGMAVDVTPTLKEEQATQASKMSALGEISSAIAHEITNPLTILSGYTSMLQNALSGPPLNIENIKMMLDKIVGTVLRMSRIISGLRTYARNAEADPMQLKPLREIVDDTLSLCQAKLKSHDIQLLIDGPIDDLTITCRPVQISQILLNLINNAYDAVEHLDERWIKVSVIMHHDRLQLSIENSGPPIPTEVRKRMFHLFFTTKGAGKGTGLGLSISKGIAEDHGGSLKLDEQAQHPRFTLTIPVKQQTAKAA